MFLGGRTASPPTPVRELYAVSRRSARTSDLYVQELARREAYGGREAEPDTPAHIGAALHEQIGAPLYEETRLLVGTIERGIYAVPSTAETICLGSFPDGGGSCGRPTRHGVRVDYEAADDDSSLLVYGIVGDDVESVEVVVGGQMREAELGENGCRLAITDGGPQQLQELILRLHGGATDKLNLHIANRLK